MKTMNVSDWFVLSGDFSMLSGELTPSDAGFSWRGEELELTTETVAHKTGVMSRRDRVKNVSDRPIRIDTALSKFSFFGGEYEVYSQYSEWCNENIGAWQPLVTEICGASDDVRMNSGANPFVAIWNEQNGRGTAFHILADSTWQYRVRRYFHQTRPRTRNVTVELGMRERNFEYLLLPGETLELPEILYYEFRNRLDMDGYKLHRYCNERYPARTVPVIYNTWLSRADDISYELLADQLEVAADLGAEYFVIDAGWFGAPKEWMESVGDWEECTHCSMRGRMKEFADLVREKGLKFGLWFEVERAAERSRTVAEHPQYYIHEDGQCFIDFANPEASEYIYGVVKKNIDKYGIEFIKSDFNAPISYDRHRHSFMDYFTGYRKFIARLKAEYPDLWLESCASGGLRMALGNLQGFDSFWMSDNHSLYAQLEIFKNSICRLPCRALERWITIQSLDCIKGRSREQILVSGDAGWGYVESVVPGFLRAASVGGPMGISCDVTAFSENLKAILREHIATYKEERDFWAHAECRILSDTPTVLVLQFNDESFDTVKVYVYLKNFHQSGMTVYPVLPQNTVYVDEAGVVRDSESLDCEGVELAFEPRWIYNAYSISFQKQPCGE